MSMRVVYLENHDGHKQDHDYFIERTLARRLCDSNIVLPYVTYLEHKKVALEKKKADLVKNREEIESETAISKKVKRSEKAKVTVGKNNKKVKR